MGWEQEEKKGHEKDGDRDRIVDGHAYDWKLDDQDSRCHWAKLSKVIVVLICGAPVLSIYHLPIYHLPIYHINWFGRTFSKLRDLLEKSSLLSVSQNLFQSQDDL